MNPVALLLGGGWRYLAGAAVLFAGYAWLTTAAYNRGAYHERAVWTARTTSAAAGSATAAAALAAARQTRSEVADTGHARRAQNYAVSQAPITHEVIRYVATPAAAITCLDVRGVQLGTAAIDAADAALAAPR